MKKANFYFLIIALLSFTSFSPKVPAISVAPLVFVLLVTAVKEAFEDYRRYRLDVATNSTKVKIFRNAEWRDTTWADIQCGDMVKVHSEEYFSSDILLLQSSSPQGACSIETANLDGETNLKIKQAVPASYNIHCEDPHGWDFPTKFKGVVESAEPNEKMDQSSWEGNLVDVPNTTGPIALGMKQLLLRGCRLRNTDWIIGIVVFTGLETKLMQQAKAKKLKRSKVERTVDQALYIIFFVQFCLCVFGAVAYSRWLNSHQFDWYLPFNAWWRAGSTTDVTKEAALSFFSFLVLLDLLVPISLYVSMELVKFVQAHFINSDELMRYEKTGIFANARTSNLNEELGQIEYIFSDKTGTLTRNEMKFQRCVVEGEEYGPGCMARAGYTKPREPPIDGIPRQAEYYFEDYRLSDHLINGPAQTQATINEFLTLLAVCHNVVPAIQDGQLTYNAQSPDEKALVEAAWDEQYYFQKVEPATFTHSGLNVDGTRVTVNIRGQLHCFEIFEQLEFTSARKCMSVVVRDPRDGLVKLYTKGADDVIYRMATEESKKHVGDKTKRALERFAKVGLRTLVCGYRVLSHDEVTRWLTGHMRAKSSMSNRKAEIDASNSLVEKDVTIVGATAIEDRLQNGVPEAIYNLAKAGIKIWVLTGDKVETAINIGRSCKLLTDKMRDDNLILINVDDDQPDAKAKEETLQALQAARLSVTRPGVVSEDMAIVVSGKALSYIFPQRKLDDKKREILPSSEELQAEKERQLLFLDICCRCKAVVCCRMSPKQKSQVVLLVKDNTKAITLSVGDGANDVAMIEAAHVGVGIEGLEGKQAVMSSDYSIAQFEYLQRLLLVHGAWSYRRLSALILYSFRKNIAISLLQIWFAFYNGFSAQVFTDAATGSLYNMIFTAWPIMLAAVFNRDLSAETMIAHPKLYQSGQTSSSFNLRLMLQCLVKAGCDSVVIFFFAVLTFCSSTSSSGQDNDTWIASTAAFTSLFLTVAAKVGLITTTWVWISHVFFWLSLLSYYLWALLYSGWIQLSSDMYFVFYRLLSMPSFWLLSVLVPAVCILPEFAWEYYRSRYWPNVIDVGRYHLDALSKIEEAEFNEEQRLAEKYAEQARLDEAKQRELEGTYVPPTPTSAPAAPAPVSSTTSSSSALTSSKLLSSSHAVTPRSDDDELIPQTVAVSLSAVGLSDAAATSGADTTATAEMRANWRRGLSRESSLGYVPIMESPNEDSFVMSASAFRNTLLQDRSNSKAELFPLEQMDSKR